MIPHRKASSANLRPSRLLCLLLLLAVSSCGLAESSASLHYSISLANPEQHLLHVTLNIPPGAPVHDLQLPVWNALYQVRDFAQYVNWVKAESLSGQALPIRKLEKSRWQLSASDQGAKVEYEIFADQAGPFGAQLNAEHAFLNFAEVLMYPVDARNSPIQVEFKQLPANWKVATALAVDAAGFRAANYDELVDSPVEAGLFAESDFTDGGALYRVAVDADLADYDMAQLLTTLRRIVAAATTWMNDRPFQQYVFIFHFPRVGGGGGMEHAYSTAIDVNAQIVKENFPHLTQVAAHEFFHLWNVKRIRPQSLEPIDYSRENYTRSLWFSEGVTSTAGDCILLRAGLLDEPHFLQHLSDEIGTLERRPAHTTQSAEESSLDAWFEKYSYYRLPERSISYYNKGELLGVLLDLTMRDATQDRTSLRDLFQTMNRTYARQGVFFPDSQGIRETAESLTHTDLGWFFAKYVSGTDPIPWDDFFRPVGLHLERRRWNVAEPGFTTSRNHGALAMVARVEADSDAARAGLSPGDTILQINGKAADAGYEQLLAALAPGDTLRLRIRNSRGETQMQWKLSGREQVVFQLKDVDNISPQQKARRAAWLSGEAQTSGDAKP